MVTKTVAQITDHLRLNVCRQFITNNLQASFQSFLRPYLSLHLSRNPEEARSATINMLAK
jgi:hypothetical protein